MVSVENRKSYVQKDNVWLIFCKICKYIPKFLNHAAVNPMFSLMESWTHMENFAEQYRFMSEKDANALFSTMVSTSDANTYPILKPEAANGHTHEPPLHALHP